MIFLKSNPTERNIVPSFRDKIVIFKRISKWKSGSSQRGCNGHRLQRSSMESEGRYRILNDTNLVKWNHWFITFPHTRTRRTPTHRKSIGKTNFYIISSSLCTFVCFRPPEYFALAHKPPNRPTANTPICMCFRCMCACLLFGTVHFHLALARRGLNSVNSELKEENIN